LLNGNNEVWLIQKKEPSKENAWGRGRTFIAGANLLLITNINATYKQSACLGSSTWELVWIALISSVPFWMFRALLRWIPGDKSENM
jgi:hypothetical protein